MAKVPVAGRVKTRLARDLGVAAATRFARHATTCVVARMANHPAWHTTVAVTPDSATRWRLWPTHADYVPQGHGDLGQRIQRIMDRSAPGPVIIVGTDIPSIGVSHIREAFRLLGRHDAVLGPATDGGYWLVGLKRRPRVPKPFRAVRWSSPQALEDTVANLSGLSVAHVATLSDVDTAEDFAHHAALSGRLVIGPHPQTRSSPHS